MVNLSERSIKLFCEPCRKKLQQGEKAPFIVRIDPKQIKSGAHAGVWVYPLSVNRRVRAHGRDRKVSEGYEAVSPWDGGNEIELHCKRCKSNLVLTYQEAERQVRLAAELKRTTGYLGLTHQDPPPQTLEEVLRTMEIILGRPPEEVKESSPDPEDEQTQD